jgi:N utilization substance protein B
MLNRRNIRSKVMQGIFAFQSAKEDNLPKNEKLLFLSFDNIYKLYVLLLLLLLALKEKASEEIAIGLKKNFPTEEDLNPNYKFVNNKVLSMLENNRFIQEFKKKYKLNKWEVNKELVDLIWKKIKNSSLYKEYMSSKSHSFIEDKEFILDLYKNFIAPETKLHETLEADESHWADDIAIANTLVMKTISSLKEGQDFQGLPPLFKDEQDREFAKKLFSKIILNDEKLTNRIKGKTPNWDYERISNIDKLILKMGIGEFLYFPSIPPSVTINEYVEIAKEFSTPKSNIFINGVLNNIYKELEAQGELNKNIRGREKK